MSNDADTNKLCVDCQLCCRGAICHVLITDEELEHFPTVDFSDRRLSRGRQYFNQPCPHIGSGGCRIYSVRPKDCASFSCGLLERLSKGELTLSEAKRTVGELKSDIDRMVSDLRRGGDDRRGFRELRRWWIGEGMHHRYPAQSRRLLSILKRLDDQFFPQSQMDELHAAGVHDEMRSSDSVQEKSSSTSTYWSNLRARRQEVASILLENDELKTPAYVVDDISLDQIVSKTRDIISVSGASLLYSVKANAVAAVIERLAPQVDGFSCSSLPEVQLVRTIAGKSASIHFVGPGIAEKDADSIFQECEKVSFNSLGLLKRFGATEKADHGWGIRVNPHLSLSRDPRYDPCRSHSQLGISIYSLNELWQDEPDTFATIGGLHVHNATGNSDFRALAATVNIIKETLPDLLHHMSWINLGGGYRIQSSKNQAIYHSAVQELKTHFGLTVYIEPGTALVRRGCWLTATVIDIVTSEGRDVAILDTSINHQLESFIYRYAPSVANASNDGRYRYQLAGASCLAGDLLGRHSFEQPLVIGSRVLFQNAGAYNHALTTRYNGLNPPDIYQIQADRGLTLRRRFNQDDFASVCGI